METKRRSLVKAVSWRITGSLDTFFISWIVTGHPKVALSITSIEFLTKILLYWSHERAWLKIGWGRSMAREIRS
jgi:uncharacterized membrane protein